MNMAGEGSKSRAFVRHVLGDVDLAVSSYCKGRVTGSAPLWRIEVELGNNDVTFDQLQRLSDAFGTKKINFRCKERSPDYSEVTPGSAASVRMVIDDIDPTKVSDEVKNFKE